MTIGRRSRRASNLPPLHMRRDAFSPTRSSGRSARPTACATVTNAFGMQVYLVTRHEDVKAVLSDHERFSNARPPGFVVPGAPQIPEEEQASARAGNLLGLDPPEHQRLRRMLTPEFTIRRMKRLEPRIVEIVDRAARRHGGRRSRRRNWWRASRCRSRHW